MKVIITITLLALMSCSNHKEAIVDENKKITQQNTEKIPQDSLFILDIIKSDSYVRITPPTNVDFSLPDSSESIEPFKFADFNADDKQDVLVYLGACGTGGCMYVLFLNEYDNKYKMAFMDYLKNPQYEIDKDSLWIIKSIEEAEAYDPSKLYVTVFKLDTSKSTYLLDTTYIDK